MGNILQNLGRPNEAATQGAYANVINAIGNQAASTNQAIQGIIQSIQNSRDRADRLNKEKAERNIAIQQEANKDKEIDFYAEFDLRKDEFSRANPQERAKILSDIRANVEANAQRRAIAMGYDTSDPERSIDEKIAGLAVAGVKKGYDKAKSFINDKIKPQQSQETSEGSGDSATATDQSTSTESAQPAQSFQMQSKSPSDIEKANAAQINQYTSPRGINGESLSGSDLNNKSPVFTKNALKMPNERD